MLTFRYARCWFAGLVLAGALPSAPAAAATLPTNGPLLFTSQTGIGTVRPDGTGRAQTWPGRDPAPAPSGTVLAVVGNLTGNDEIYRTVAGGSGSPNLTNSPAEDRDPSWSAAGQIAFSSTRAGGPHLFAMDANGGNVRQLTDGPSSDRQPSWSPDGSALVFVRDSDLYVRDASGAVRALTADGMPKADPSWGASDEIAFSVRTGEVWQVDAIRPDGGGRRRLTTGASAVWSPDGRQLAYAAGDELRVITPTGRDTGLRPGPAGTDLAWAAQPAATTRPAEGSFTVRRVRGTVLIRDGQVTASDPLPAQLHGAVTTDDRVLIDATGGRVIVEIRVRKGHRKITTMTASNGRFSVEQRSPGAAPVIKPHGLPPCRPGARVSKLFDFNAIVRGKGKYLGRYGRASAVGTVWKIRETCRTTAIEAISGELTTEKANSKSTGVARTTKRTLWGSKKGKFQTRGRFGSATIRG